MTGIHHISADLLLQRIQSVKLLLLSELTAENNLYTLAIHFPVQIKDMHFEKLKNVEVLGDQLNLLRDASEYVGKYFSIEYVRKNILDQTEEDIARIDQQIMQEIEREQIKSQDDIEQGMWEAAEEPAEDFHKIELSVETENLQINTKDIIEEKDPEYEAILAELKKEISK